MLKKIGYLAVFAVAVLLFAVHGSSAAEGVKGNLVDAKWLEANLKNPDVLILDASPAQLYKAKHIPGAISVEIFTLMTYGIREMPLTHVEGVYQSLGISPGKKVVMYDQGGTWFAPRLFFSLDYHGFPTKDLYLLDGGLAKWEADKLPVTADATPAPVKGSFKIGKVNEDVRVRLPEFVTASGDTANNVLLEALGADWHFGEVRVFPKVGHVPNAVMLPSDDYFNPDKTFKSAEEIKKMLAYLSVRPEQQIYAHCGGGGAAAVPFFALKVIANYPKVKLYTESQMGWQSDERDLPYWTYDAPYLMRETNWLQAWGGKMMRMYGQSNVSVVDVRPAGAYSQGHVPFAVNIPADVFKNNIATPDRLAQVLASAGVNPAHEAVVISSTAVNKDSALAFVMLEKLGQKKVSVFAESIDSPDTADKMSQRGFALTKDATVVGAKKSPSDLSIPTTTYPANVRTGVVIADPKSTQGAYPKVFVASGGKVPAKAPDGKVVHVPYTDLLNADGTPKAAKDVWNILTKAGIPRYAELVFFSDDPGEAAANYFVLKLMGYPDIKVLAI